MKKYLVALLLSVTFISCESLGTKQIMYDKTALTNIKSIGISYFRFNQKAFEDIDKVQPVIKDALLNNLNQTKQFQKVVTFDSLFANLSEKDENNFNNALKIAKEQQMDAFIVCDLKIVKSSYMFIPIYDAEVVLHLCSTETEKEILNTTFSTKNGKSYWWPPNEENIIRDATESAVRAFSSNFPKL